MIKKVGITIIFYYLAIGLFYFYYYGSSPFFLYQLSNAFFIISLPVFFFSLISLTNATKLFTALTYYFKRATSKIDSSYFDYFTKDNKKRNLSYWTIILFISIFNIIFSLLIV
jgi:Mn2+/Fe2+ NRAMP family transporter